MSMKVHVELGPYQMVEDDEGYFFIVRNGERVSQDHRSYGGADYSLDQIIKKDRDEARRRRYSK